MTTSSRKALSSRSVSLNSHNKFKDDQSVYSSVVEFFNASESDFSDLSMHDRTLQEIKQQLFLEFESIFETLRNILVPHEHQNSQENISHVIHRAQLLYKQTLPEVYKNIEKNQYQMESLDQIMEYQESLKKLIIDYKNYKEKQIEFDIFFNRYGGTKKLSFDRKECADTVVVNIMGDSLKIISNDEPKLMKSMGTSLYQSNNFKQLLQFSCKSAVKNKQLEEARQQILKSKLKEQTIEKQTSNRILKAQKQCAERIRNILSIYSEQEPCSRQKSLLEELEVSQKKVQQLFENCENQKNKIIQLEETLMREREKNSLYSSQIDFMKRTSGFDECKENMNLLSVETLGDPKKMKKHVEKISYQNSLLKKELSKVRENNDKMDNRQLQSSKKENIELKKQLRVMSQQFNEVAQKLDQFKIENIRLASERNRLQKMLELAKAKVYDDSSNPQENPFDTIKEAEKKMLIKVCDYSINNVPEPTEQENPFYQLLTKQFRIRYKRCCLKEKDLLYKANGLEVGIIRQFQKPNRLKCILHFSNSSGNTITDLKVKISNSRNQVEAEKSEIKQIRVGEQKRCVVRLIISNYPVGQTLLTYNYLSDGKQEQFKLQLPMNILKMIEFKPIDGQIHNPITKTIEVQKKIARQFDCMVSYFPGSTIDTQRKIISGSLLHEASETKLLMQIKEKDSNIYEITHEIRSGEAEIGRMIMRNLYFLLGKDQ